ncbi:HAD-IA family hydrolase [Pseudarthrobacter sp. NPDC080039]|uniref:HAD-IA family hydrolase n=1 Tax=unclassified Pseudarthrobacter TaxID=2647000 RepID=UPI0034501BCC
MAAISGTAPAEPDEVTFVPCEAILFDCDGVLVESDQIVLHSWTRWAEHMQLNPEDVIATVHGRRSADTVADFIHDDRRQDAADLIDAMEIEDAAAVTTIPGAAELVASIPSDRWATVTSGSRNLATARLTAAHLPIPAILVTAGDVQNGKPHPEGYLAGARGLAVPIGDCVVIEDAAAGIRAARAAKAGYIIGVGNREVGEHTPDIMVTDLRSLRWTGAGLEIQTRRATAGPGVVRARASLRRSSPS